MEDGSEQEATDRIAEFSDPQEPPVSDKEIQHTIALYVVIMYGLTILAFVGLFAYFEALPSEPSRDLVVYPAGAKLPIHIPIGEASSHWKNLKDFAQLILTGETAILASIIGFYFGSKSKS